MFLTVGLLSFVAALCAFAMSLDLGVSTRSVVRARLRPGGPLRVEKESKGKAIQSESHLGAIRFLVRRRAVSTMERELLLAGLASTWRLSTVVLLKVLLPVIVFIPLALWTASDFSWKRSIVSAVVLLVAYSIPSRVVHSRAQDRQSKILYDLPDVLDQITISIESGLGFEAALARVGQSNKGPLGGEIVRVVQDSRLGMSRRDAYQAMADRSDVDDLRRFIKSIIQAEEFGVPISRVVRTQAEELRVKRRQRAEEQAAKVALKLLFPMLFCMFPVLFILILTPAIVNMGKAFG